MAIDKNKLASIISGNAKALCSPQGDRMISEITNQRVNNPNGVQSRNYMDYNDDFITESYNDREANDMNYSYSDIQNSKLPDFIKQSFAEQRIDMTGTGGLSILDGLPIENTPRQRRQPQQKRQMVSEQVMPTQVNNTNSGIDYSIIKAIVNECLKEHFEKQTLNESASLKTIALKEGVISLVDNKGNIFKAKLEKIGNKNDKN